MINLKKYLSPKDFEEYMSYDSIVDHFQGQEFTKHLWNTGVLYTARYGEWNLSVTIIGEHHSDAPSNLIFNYPECLLPFADAKSKIFLDREYSTRFIDRADVWWGDSIGDTPLERFRTRVKCRLFMAYDSSDNALVRAEAIASGVPEETLDQMEKSMEAAYRIL